MVESTYVSTYKYSIRVHFEELYFYFSKEWYLYSQWYTYETLHTQVKVK